MGRKEKLHANATLNLLHRILSTLYTGTVCIWNHQNQVCVLLRHLHMYHCTVTRE
jgi:hypothetical protein